MEVDATHTARERCLNLVSCGVGMTPEDSISMRLVRLGYGPGILFVARAQVSNRVTE